MDSLIIKQAQDKKQRASQLESPHCAYVMRVLLIQKPSLLLDTNDI